MYATWEKDWYIHNSLFFARKLKGFLLNQPIWFRDMCIALEREEANLRSEEQR